MLDILLGTGLVLFYLGMIVLTTIIGARKGKGLISCIAAVLTGARNAHRAPRAQ